MSPRAQIRTGPESTAPALPHRLGTLTATAGFLGNRPRRRRTGPPRTAAHHVLLADPVVGLVADPVITLATRRPMLAGKEPR